MKQFQSKLDKLYEGLNLKKTYSEESKRPDFDPINDFLIARVYDHIDKNVLGYDWDYSDKEIVNNLMGQFKQIKDMIERTYSQLNKETKTAPDGHYYTKSGNLVKGRLSADAQERGARKSDPKDKQRSKTPPVSQYNEDDIDITSWAPDKEFKGKGDMWRVTPPGIPQKDIGGEGTFEISVDQSTLIVSIDDVEDRIDIGKLNDLKTGKPIDINSTAGMIRIRARLEALLRKMGYDVGGPFVPDNKYEVKVNHNNKTFKLVRKPGR